MTDIDYSANHVDPDEGRCGSCGWYLYVEGHEPGCPNADYCPTCGDQVLDDSEAAEHCADIDSDAVAGGRTLHPHDDEEPNDTAYRLGQHLTHAANSGDGYAHWCGAFRGHVEALLDTVDKLTEVITDECPGRLDSTVVQTALISPRLARHALAGHDGWKANR